MKKVIDSDKLYFTKCRNIAVLMSTYNGAAFLQSQIESILSQTIASQLELFIRDDGSTDGTKDILEKMAASPNIHVEYGSNVGFINSFLTLLKNCGEFDYYSYSDQDDVWLPQKIERAVAALEKERTTVPTLYFSNYDYYNASMQFLGHAHAPQNISFPNCLVDCAPLGFTCVMNKAARDLIAARIPVHACGHDWWTYMVCCGLGKVIFDDVSTVRYRRTGNNVSGGGKSFIAFQIWRFKKFFVDDYFTNITQMLREYETLFGSRLKESDQKILALFTKKTVPNALKKIFFPRKFRQNATDEVFLRLCFLLGRL